MASSFLKAAGKQVTDARTFLRDAAGGTSIKYVVERGAKHLIYVPYINVEVVDDDGNTRVEKQIIALSGDVHEWKTADGKFKSVVCAKGKVVVDDNNFMLNNGECPFCDRVQDSWEIFNYRKKLEEDKCLLTGDERENHMKNVIKTIGEERKAKEVHSYMYLLVVKYRADAANNLVIGADKLPEYDLKVMKISSSRVTKIQQQVANAGAEFAGSELIFEYPNIEHKAAQVSQSTIAPVFPNNMVTAKFPTLINKINNDVTKFEWDGIEKAFPEWVGMTTAEATKVVAAMFEKWDQFKAELALNPDAKYMEYISDIPKVNPAISGATIPNGVNIPTAAVPGVEVPGAANVPVAAPVMPDINEVFGGASAGGIKL